MGSMADNEYRRMGKEILENDARRGRGARRGQEQLETHKQRMPYFEETQLHSAKKEPITHEGNEKHHIGKKERIDASLPSAMTFDEAFAAVQEQGAGEGDQAYGAAFSMMIDNNLDWSEAALTDDAYAVFNGMAITDEDAQAWASAPLEVRDRVLDDFAAGAPTNVADSVAHHMQGNEAADPAMMDREMQHGRERAME